MLAASACLILAACESLLFHPTPEVTVDPRRLGLAYREVSIETADGLALDAWFLPAEAARDTGCSVLFLHGNAGNMGTHLPSVG